MSKRTNTYKVIIIVLAITIVVQSIIIYILLFNIKPPWTLMQPSVVIEHPPCYNAFEFYRVDAYYREYNETHVLVYINLSIRNIGEDTFMLKNIVIRDYNFTPIDSYKVANKTLHPGEEYTDIIRVIIIDKNSSLIQKWKPGTRIDIRFYYICLTDGNILWIETPVNIIKK